MPTLIERARTRIRSIYSSQKRRAKKYGAELTYTADDLCDHLLPLGSCTYCGARLTPKGFQVDHTMPLARGGSWELSNTQAICTPCNRRKNSLLHDEFIALLAFLDTQGDYVKRNVLARMAAGGAWLAARF
jgi:5-methylcytosine-specific restriction endonuclease McrA